jgi:FkbM family methyltransferase
MAALTAGFDRIWRLRSYVYRALDRPPFRGLLGAIATWTARREAGADVEIIFRPPVWMYRVGDRYLPGEQRFVFRHGGELRGLPAYERRQAEDFWLHTYRPEVGDVVVDVGAGIGAETHVFAEEVRAVGRVISIEANPSTFTRLEARVRANRLENVTLVHAALVDRSRPVFVEDRPEVHERNTVSVERRARDLSAPVDGVSLDELCEREDVDRIDLLKMNIEGAERLAIGGMTRMIERTHAVCIACHGDDADGTKAPVLAFLRASGFEIVTREDDERDYVRDHVHGIRR